MFERYTERARQVVVLGQDEARLLGHSYIGTEHLLLGLLREEEGLAARVLGTLNVGTDVVRAQVAAIVGRGEVVSVGQIPFTPRAKKVLELGLREALSLGHNFIGTEHILLGLVRENEGVGARILDNLSITAEAVRNEVIRHLSGPSKKVDRRMWHRVDVSPNQVWERRGELFRVVGIADEPTVIVENVKSGVRESHVIASLNVSQFVRLDPADVASATATDSGAS